MYSKRTCAIRDRQRSTGSERELREHGMGVGSTVAESVSNADRKNAGLASQLLLQAQGLGVEHTARGGKESLRRRPCFECTFTFGLRENILSLLSVCLFFPMLLSVVEQRKLKGGPARCPCLVLRQLRCRAEAKMYLTKLNAASRGGRWTAATHHASMSRVRTSPTGINHAQGVRCSDAAKRW